MTPILTDESHRRPCTGCGARNAQGATSDRRPLPSMCAWWASHGVLLAVVVAASAAGATATGAPRGRQSPAVAAAAVGVAVDGAATFDAAWQAITDSFVDGGPSEADWARLRDEFRPRAVAAPNDAAVREVLREMLARLGRSHFEVMPGDTATPSAEADGAEANGDVGLEITPLDDQPVVTRVVPSGPADRAGVRPGWTIRQVRGHDPRRAVSSSAGPLRGFRLWAATVSLLRGGTGTSVPIDFLDNDGQPVAATLTRVAQDGQPVKLGHLPTFVAHLDHRTLDAPGGGAVGYVHFNVWMTPLAAAIDRAVDASRGAPGLIMDLRQNPGGVLTMLMGVSGHFFDSPRSLGTLRTRGSELRLIANPRLANADGTRVTAYAGRLAILVDETSYSASEIFAGGMQAAGRARVFGTRTPGGALPALVRRLPNGDLLEYAIGDFVTVTGDRIEGRGVVPDEPVRPSPSMIASGRDPVLEAAVRWAAGGGQ